MGRIAIVFFLLVQVSTVRSEIKYDSKEFRPQGKHYTVKDNFLYYSLYPNAKTDRMTLLYFKTPSKAIIFKGFWISKSLEEKLPMVVVKYIGKYTTDLKLKETHSIEDAIDVTKKAVAKALDKKWLENLKDNSAEFSVRPLYKRDYAGFDMNYYEFFPLEKMELTNPTSLDDTIVLDVFVDSIFKVHKTFIESGSKISELRYNLLKKPDFDKSIDWQKYRYDNLMDVITKLAARKYHHKNLKISDWPLTSTKSWELSTSTPNGFHGDVDSTCKYLMTLSSIKKEQLMPVMAWKQNYGNWKATRCNMFAGDFSMQTLGLSTYPWGTKDLRAHEIHAVLPGNKDFVPITWANAWKYANMGYAVFVTQPKVGEAGHIAIAYPVKKEIEKEIVNCAKALSLGQIVQAGKNNGVMLLKDGFADIKNFDIEVKLYVYLGHLKIGA